MTNIQAINLLKGLEQSLDDYCELNDEGKTAFRMAITALEVFGNSEQLPSAQPEQRWIPVSDRLPEYGKSVLCYFKEDEDFDVNHVIDEEDGEWFIDGVTAWMPLPEPYREEGRER